MKKGIHLEQNPAVEVFENAYFNNVNGYESLEQLNKFYDPLKSLLVFHLQYFKFDIELLSKDKCFINADFDDNNIIITFSFKLY